MYNRLSLLAFVILLSACSSSGQAPQMHHYVLDDVAERFDDNANLQIAEVSVIAIPDYLNQNALVMMVDNHKLEIAQYHTWADSLNDSIARVVEHEYNNLLAASPDTKRCDDCHRIAISVERFYPSSDGKVYLSGYYRYQNNDKEVVKRRFNLSGEIQSDGYQGSVAEMRRLLTKLSEEIATNAI